MRWPRQLMSLLFVLAFLVGPPVVLLTVIGPPLRGWPTTDQLRAWLQQPLTEETLTAGLAIGAWLIWLLVAYTVAVRIIVRLRATTAWLRRVPLPTPLQATASGMAGAAVFGVATNTVTTPPEPPQPVLTGTATLHDETAPDDHRDQAGREDGVTVAGGWLPRDVAEQVTAAAALVWLRRRRDYQPHPTHPDDTDLTPLPPTVTAVQAALADTPSAPPSDGSTTPFAALPVGGVGLTGPGTLPIGRGLLVTAILAGQRPSSTSLIVTKATLALLLGPAAETLGRRLPLTIVDTIDEAAQLLQPDGPATEESSPGQRPDELSSGPNHRTIVLLNEHDGDEEQLTQLAATGTATAALLVVLGKRPDGPNWHANSTGHLHDPHHPIMPSPRLCVLDQTAATDLLSVIARPAPPPPHTATEPPLHPYTGSPDVPLPRQVDRPRPQRLHRTPQQQLHLRILGDPQLLIDDEPLAIRRSASLQVLVFLAIHSNGANTAQLTDAIWPGLPRRSLTGRLYTALSDLRSTIRTASDLPVIDHADDRYRLSPKHIDVDLWNLHATIHQAAAALTHTAAAWQTVLDAYPADLATTRTWPWLDPHREATRRRIIDLCAALAAKEPDPHRSLQLLQDGISIDPHNADLHGLASGALTALGHPQTAAEL
ncbi:DNA-binding transcriptional activator of the SARP family [Micromonospora rifamycinica]|uniref:DNA-binding transcriptional activator of the SARP family n=2 Tax=Micromonospora rifamycinica TaxID=291594 RepID=A0A1C5KFN9_9ACTN|nr:DNA-binding transcriptional activator of the SARP family [Micromonospora rifamycinica]